MSVEHKFAAQTVGELFLLIVLVVSRLHFPVPAFIGGTDVGIFGVIFPFFHVVPQLRAVG
ncbi:hypothetical protein D3C72_2309000 [compost metagenome]